MNKVFLYWWNNVDNVGDYYSKWLLEHLVDNDVEHSNTPDIVCCGSILASNILKPTTKIWGVGFNNYYSDQVVMDKEQYYAVRGRMTYDKLNLTKEIALGDTGLLLSYFYKEKVEKKYDVGFVLHFQDMEYETKLQKFGKVINMGTTEVERIAKEISECRFIYSSSLHGVIFAHSLGIPAIHLEISQLSSRNNFKFMDYYSVLDVPYYKEIYDDKFTFLKCNKDECLPSKRRIKKIQEDLLLAFPYPRKESI